MYKTHISHVLTMKRKPGVAIVNEHHNARIPGISTISFQYKLYSQAKQAIRRCACVLVHICNFLSALFEL